MRIVTSAAWSMLLATGGFIAVAFAADDVTISTSAIVQIVGIVVPVIGSLGLAWFNLRAGQRAQSEKLTLVETKASDLDKKVDGVKADVAQVHEATNGLSHRLAAAAGEAGFGQGQEKERGDQRLRAAEAAAGTSPPLAAPAAPRDTLRNAVEQIQQKTDQLTFTNPRQVDAGPTSGAPSPPSPSAEQVRAEMLMRIEALLIEFKTLPTSDPPAPNTDRAPGKPIPPGSITP